MDKPRSDGIQQRPRSGATRCPYCHDECEAGQEACACADCLSRHHLGCWDEAGGCSSCRSTNRLVATSGTSTTPAETSGPRYGEVIDAWLKLGLVYNAGLAALTLFFFGKLLFEEPEVAVEVAVGAAIANLCFLLGPVIELVARRLGFEHTRSLRWGLFLTGSCVAGALVLLSLVELGL